MNGPLCGQTEEFHASRRLWANEMREIIRGEQGHLGLTYRA